MVNVSSITSLIFNAIPMIAEGRGEEVSIKEIQQHIENEDIIQFLQDKFPFEKNGMDLSLLLNTEASSKIKIAEITKHLQQVNGAYEGRERRKMGITKNGLCYLVGLCTEIIQTGQWTEPTY